jgi:soluble lytic murein transglycosylase-like protein
MTTFPPDWKRPTDEMILLIQEAANLFGVPENLVYGVIRKESNFDRKARGSRHAGNSEVLATNYANHKDVVIPGNNPKKLTWGKMFPKEKDWTTYGLMQLLPYQLVGKTAGVPVGAKLSDLYKSAPNIRLGVAYLGALHKKFPDSWGLVLVHYNATPGYAMQVAGYITALNDANKGSVVTAGGVYVGDEQEFVWPAGWVKPSAKYIAAAKEAAEKYGVPIENIFAITRKESSRFSPSVMGRVLKTSYERVKDMVIPNSGGMTWGQKFSADQWRALGIMQVLPFNLFGVPGLLKANAPVTAALDTRLNVLAGARVLKQWFDKTGSWEDAILKYNGAKSYQKEVLGYRDEFVAAQPKSGEEVAPQEPEQV